MAEVSYPLAALGALVGLMGAGALLGRRYGRPANDAPRSAAGRLLATAPRPMPSS